VKQLYSAHEVNHQLGSARLITEFVDPLTSRYLSHLISIPNRYFLGNWISLFRPVFFKDRFVLMLRVVLLVEWSLYGVVCIAELY